MGSPAKCSRDTALCDIAQLVERGIKVVRSGKDVMAEEEE
jgi:hypothetical protein